MQENSTFSAQFHEIFSENDLGRFCTDQIVQAFEQFTDLLCQVNAHTNLTAIREIPDIISKHYADCLLAEPHFAQSASVLDVGCGGGFPSIPLAIARPDLRITAIDSTAKKIAFVQEAANMLPLPNLTPICTRIEDRSFASKKNSFDIGTSRAVAKLSVLVELILPYIRQGGALVALKGASGEDELTEAQHAISILGGEVAQVDRFQLRQGTNTEQRTIIVIKKTRATPPQYPRQYSAILKKPL